MAVGQGTVRGAFDLDTRPAIRGVREYRREAARADAQTRQLGNSMDDAFGRQGGSIREMTDDLGSLRSEMRAVESELIPVMNRKTRAVNEQTRAVRALRYEVLRLGNTRALARVDVTGIKQALAQVELLHSRVNAFGRESASARLGVSGGAGLAAARAASAGGGAAGGGRGLLSLGGIGFGGLRGGTLLAVGGGLLPAAQGLIGGGAGVLASAGAAAGGAGVVGLGGLAPLVTGLGMTAAVAKPANTALEEGVKLQEALTKAVREYGRQSDQAATARDRLNAAIARDPGMRSVIRERQGFSRDWRRLTRPGREQYYGLLTDVMRIGRQRAPVLASDANLAMGAVRGAGTDFAQHMTGREMLGNLNLFTREFARDLPIAERALENSATAMARLARAALPFFHEGVEWAEDWTEGWADSVENIGETRRQMGDLVDSGKEWVELLDASWDLLKTIGGAGRASGDSLVGSLTGQLREWNAEMRANPAQTRRFFEDAADSTREMATAMRDFTGLLHEVADVLGPTFDRVMQLLQGFSNLGLLAPGVASLALGGYRGARGMMGGGVPGGPAAVPIPVGAGGAVAGGAGLYGARSAMGTYSLQRQAFGATRFQAARTAAGGMFGRGVSPLAGGVARGAARAYWPVALGLGVLDFAGYEGSFGERTQAAISSATLGAIPRPRTDEEQEDRGTQIAMDFLSTFAQPGTREYDRRPFRAEKKSLADLTNRMLRQRALETSEPGADEYKFEGSTFTKQEFEAYGKTLRDEWKTRQYLVEEMKRERDARQRERQRQRGLEYGGRLPAAMRVYERAGMSPQAAAEATAEQAGKRLGTIGRGGVEALGESSLQWARQLEKAHPEMSGIVDSIADDIERRYRKMGRRVQIVNGDILTGSKREWKQISAALQDPIERARQKVEEDFTAIQLKAIGSLRGMGFSGSEARMLVQTAEGGGSAGSAARRAQAMGPTSLVNGAVDPHLFRDRRKARGGIVAGTGLSDTVPMGDGLVAPGEAWIANRHTMRDLSRATLSTFGFTAEQMIAGEHRRHSSRGFARGGMVTGDTDVLPALMSRLQAMSQQTGRSIFIQSGRRTLAEQAALFAQKGPGLAAAPTPNAPHVRGIAADITPGAAAFSGVAGRFGLYFPMSYEPWHIQLQDPGAGGMGARGSAGVAGGMGLGHIRLRGVGRRQPGVPGALRQRAGDMYAGGLQRRINQTLDRMGGGGGGMGLGGFSGGGSAAENMRLGRRMMLAAGWGMDQWSALRELWMRESGWSASAHNPSSGAHGIPQSLPASKMASAGRDYMTSAATQIRWGLNYIRGRYGSPAAALAFHNSHNWYSRGGRMDWAGGFDRAGSFVTNGPTHFVAGEGGRRRERVTVTPAGVNANRAGGGVQIGNISVQVVIEGGIKSREDENRIAERVGEKVVRNIIEAIDKGETAGVI